MLPWMWFALQVLSAFATYWLMRQRVLPRVWRVSSPRMVLDVWGPLVLALPLIVWAFNTSQDAGSTGWPAFGGWGLIAGWSIGSALWSAGGAAAHAAGGRWLIGALSGAAVLALLLAAAHEMTVWVGQAAFAMGAVVLWINSPSAPDPPPGPVDSGGAQRASLRAADARITASLLLAMLCSAAHGACALALTRSATDWIGWSSIVLVLTALITISRARIEFAGTGRSPGGASPGGPTNGAAALRLGGWAAVFALLFGLGGLALAHMVRQVLALWGPQASRWAGAADGAPSLHVAYGFGAFALEAALVLLAVALLLAAARPIHAAPGRNWRRIAGLIIMLATIALGVWRFMGL